MKVFRIGIRHLRSKWAMPVLLDWPDAFNQVSLRLVKKTGTEIELELALVPDELRLLPEPRRESKLRPAPPERFMCRCRCCYHRRAHARALYRKKRQAKRLRKVKGDKRRTVK